MPYVMNSAIRLSVGLLSLVAVAAFSCGDDGAPPPDDAAPAVDAPAPDAGRPGGDCGGFAGLMCAPGYACDYAGNNCGVDDSLGACIPRPAGCPGPAQWVCGCDGNVYDGECEANSAGVDVSLLGGCTAPLDTFPCGFRFCAANTQYCRLQISDVAGFPDEYECIDVPAACGATPDCACLSNESCGDMCEVRPGDGSLLLTCPGG